MTVQGLPVFVRVPTGNALAMPKRPIQNTAFFKEIRNFPAVTIMGDRELQEEITKSSRLFHGFRTREKVAWLPYNQFRPQASACGTFPSG
jgi:hypothetical protein